MIAPRIGLSLPALAGAAYFLLALIAALRRPDSPKSSLLPPVSILKPIRGRDERLYEALLSHVTQDYPTFEILFGVADPADPALADIYRLIAGFPHIPIRLITELPDAPNGKVGALMGLAAHARHAILVVNDSDILVEPEYLRRVTAPLANPSTGLVTCLYRARGQSFPGRFEALGIATDFAPSVLVARLLGMAGFALGSTMVFRREHLDRIGGFAAIAPYLADDYQLGARIHALGLEIRFADSIVETNLGSPTWAQVWQHQVRWARTIRVSRTGGYLGAVITHATLWASVAALAGAWQTALFTLAIRFAAGFAAGKRLKTKISWWLIPFRDLFGAAVWFAGLFGSTVTWRNRKLRLRSDGVIEPLQ